MIKKYFFGALSLLAFALFCLPSCNLIDPPETIPCYGHIDSIGVTTNHSQGTASSKISCAWVYVDDQPVGTFELPCTFPMIATSGMHTISIYPGVSADGAASTRAKYTFLNFYSANVNITQGAITKFNYTSTYLSTVQFVWMEDFESPSNIITSLTRDTINTDSSVHIHKTNPPDVFQGGHSAEIDLDSTGPITTIQNQTSYLCFTDTMTLPHDGSPVFLEMNYNTNNQFGVGLCISNDGTNNFYTGYEETPPIVTVLPANGWQKIYIDLTSGLNNFTGKVHIYFSMYRQPGVQAKLLIDNIKVLHIKGS